MNPTPDELLLARWLDGELTAQEHAAFDERLKSDPALRAEAHELQHLREALKTGFPAITEVPHADFFNSQVQASILELQREKDRAAVRQPAAAASPSSWKVLRWLLAGALASCAIAFIALWSGGHPQGTVVLTTYTPHTNIQAKAFHSVEANATVIMLNGLEEIPSDRVLKGLLVHHSETNTEVGMTTLYSEHGETLGVLAANGPRAPRIFAR